MTNGFTYKGIHSSTKGLNVLKWHDPLLPPSRDKKEEVPNMDGAWDFGTNYGPRPISCTVSLKEESLTNIKTAIRSIAGWLNPKAGKGPLVNDNEPGVTYTARVSGEIPLEEQINPYEEFTIEFIAFDPIAFSAEVTTIKEAQSGDASVTITNAGTYETRPVIEIEGRSQVTFVGTFGRPSVAYKFDGSMVNSGLPRYENGYFHNLLSDNVASGTDTLSATTGFTVNNAGTTISSDTTEYWQGSRSFKTVCDGTLTVQGAITAVTPYVVPGKTYTASVYLKGTGIIDFGIGSTFNADITLTSTWTRYSVTTTYTSGAWYILMLANNNTVATFYADGLQLEEGSVAKAWILPSLGKGITAEEANSNLLSANQSNVETDTTGFSPINANATLTRDTTEKWEGSASLKIVTTGVGSGEGFLTSGIATTANLPYVGRVRLKGSGTVKVFLRSSVTGVNSAETVVTLTSNWQDVLIGVWQHTANTSDLTLRVATATTSAITFYADALQLEQKAYATTWQIGGTARAAETCTIPTSGVFNKGDITIQFMFKPTATQVVTGKIGALWTCYIDASNYYQLRVHSDGRYYLMVVSGGVTYSTYNSSDPVLSVGTNYQITAKMNGLVMSHFANGVKGLVGDKAYTEPIGTLPTNMYLGSSNTGASQANGIYDDLRISSRARTDAEILEGYTANVPLPIDNYTTAKMDLNGNLNVTGITTGVPGGSETKTTNPTLIFKKNLLTDNQAGVETNTTGLGTGDLVNPATLSRDLTEYWQGSSSLKAVTSGAIDLQGFQISSLAAKANTKYTASAYVKAPLGANLKLSALDFTNLPGATQNTSFTGTGDWQRVSL
jgi:predicted phage tail component-like protein